MDATFVLGRIDEVDTTWINGRFVQNSFGYGTKREYPLEAGALRAGVNQITVNVLNTWDAGGMLGPAEEVGIRFANGSFLSLGDAWQYRFIPREVGEPPRSPWESVAGVSGMFNGMSAPLGTLQPAGVIWYQGESNVANSSSYHGLLTALVSFLEYDLGYFDEERDRVEPGPSPFMPDKVLTMCPEQGVNHVTG
jgi:sialate O-acetylesterase